MSIDGQQMDKPIVVRPHHRTPLSQHNTHTSWGDLNNSEAKGSSRESLCTDASVYMTSWQRQSYRDRQQFCASRDGGGGWAGGQGNDGKGTGQNFVIIGSAKGPFSSNPYISQEAGSEKSGHGSQVTQLCKARHAGPGLLPSTTVTRGWPLKGAVCLLSDSQLGKKQGSRAF